MTASNSTPSYLRCCDRIRENQLRSATSHPTPNGWLHSLALLGTGIHASFIGIPKSLHQSHGLAIKTDTSRLMLPNLPNGKLFTASHNGAQPLLLALPRPAPSPRTPDATTGRARSFFRTGPTFVNLAALEQFCEAGGVGQPFALSRSPPHLSARMCSQRSRECFRPHVAGVCVAEKGWHHGDSWLWVATHPANQGDAFAPSIHPCQWRTLVLTG